MNKQIDMKKSFIEAFILYVLFCCILNTEVLSFGKDYSMTSFNLWVRFLPAANFYKDDRNGDKSFNAADQTSPLQCNPLEGQVNTFKRLTRNSELIPQKSLH